MQREHANKRIHQGILMGPCTGVFHLENLSVVHLARQNQKEEPCYVKSIFFCIVNSDLTNGTSITQHGCRLILHCADRWPHAPQPGRHDQQPNSLFRVSVKPDCPATLNKFFIVVVDGRCIGCHMCVKPSACPATSRCFTRLYVATLPFVGSRRRIVFQPWPPALAM